MGRGRARNVHTACLHEGRAGRLGWLGPDSEVPTSSSPLTNSGPAPPTHPCSRCHTRGGLLCTVALVAGLPLLVRGLSPV